MYPASEFNIEGGYTEADLPNAITLLGVGSIAKSGSDYGNTTNGVILESGVWAVYLAGVRTTKACLIDDDGNLTPGDDVVEDQFSATYTVNNFFFTGYCPEYDDGSPYDNIVLERSSLCGWGPTNFEVLYKNELGEYSYVTAAMSLFFDGISGALNATGPQCSTGDISQTESPHPDPTGSYSESAIVS